MTTQSALLPSLGVPLVDIKTGLVHPWWARFFMSLPRLADGTYTPTLTNVANVSSSTAYECQYLRVGDTVVVSGKIDIDPTLTTTSTQLGISLPIESDLTNASNCCGTAVASGIAGQVAAIIADTTNNRAQLQYISSDVTNQPMYFVFSYVIIR